MLQRATAKRADTGLTKGEERGRVLKIYRRDQGQEGVQAGDFFSVTL
jgi:hypothetical protein